tara:strand:- start:2090 stop:2689 length:600 start_codon:yes stop_codon:yes gene_type:complete
MNKIHERIHFISILVLAIISTSYATMKVKEYIVPSKTGYSNGYLGEFSDFPQPFVKGRRGVYRGPGTLCSKDACLTEECRQEWDSISSTTPSTSTYDTSLDDVMKCKEQYFRKLIYSVILYLILILIPIYLLYSLPKESEINTILTVLYVIPLSFIYMVAAIGGAMGQGIKGFSGHIFSYWTYYNTLFSIYIFIYHVFF